MGNGSGSKPIGTPFGEGAPPILVYFSGDWDVHRGYGILTHGGLWDWGDGLARSAASCSAEGMTPSQTIGDGTHILLRGNIDDKVDAGLWWVGKDFGFRNLCLHPGLL